MVSIYGVFSKDIPVSDQGLEIISDEAFDDGAIRVSDLVQVIAGDSRCAGERTDHVGHASAVIEFNGRLYYRIVS